VTDKLLLYNTAVDKKYAMPPSLVLLLAASLFGKKNLRQKMDAAEKRFGKFR